LRSEVHPKGAEIVTVSLELSGPEASRPFIEAAHPEHPSLIDAEHRMDALFGVVNIPNVVWIDEEGLIVRPAEPGWPDARQEFPASMAKLREAMPKLGRAKTAPPPPPQPVGQLAMLQGGQDRGGYAGALRDWVEKGASSEYALTPDEVVARSQTRSPDLSAGADHLWRSGRRDLALGHFNEAHRLQPGNWTYKRQAWSLVGNERVGGDFGRFVQAPLEGEEDDWPFVSDFHSDTAILGEGEYYPKTL
jgi:hypothetical protein